MRAFIQQFLPLMKDGKTMLECLDDRLKRAFKKDYTKLKPTLIKFIKCRYLSFIKHDKQMYNRYWKYVINDTTFSSRIPNYEIMTSFYKSIENVLQKENELIEKLPKLNDYRVLLEYHLLNKARQCFRNFDNESFLSITDDYFHDCLISNGIVGVS